jgi:RNA polymerase-binding transcription factor DksA
MTIDYENFKNRLENEKQLLEKELEKVGHKNPDIQSDWEADSPEDRDVSPADENTLADAAEEYGDNIAIVSTLEKRYNSVKQSLSDIENGKYGLCEICGQEIESDRLEANPSARTCKEHLNVS